MLSIMKCPAYSIMNIVWHTVQFLQVRTEEVWQKILQELGHCGCLWSLILGGSMKSCCGCLGQMLVNFSVSHSMVLPVEHHEKLCFIVPSFGAGTILLSKMCHFIQWNIWDGFFCKWLWDICTIWKLLVVGIKVSLPSVKCICLFFFFLRVLNIHFFM